MFYSHFRHDKKNWNTEKMGNVSNVAQPGRGGPSPDPGAWQTEQCSDVSMILKEPGNMKYYY